MTIRNVRYWMWAEACETLDRATGLHRSFFEPAAQTVSRPQWEPPVDVFETERMLWVIVALPGVPAEHVELLVVDDRLVVTGLRALPEALRAASVRRLEIPAGRFERRIELPPGRFELIEQALVDGCLTIGLRKRDGSWSRP